MQWDDFKTWGHLKSILFLIYNWNQKISLIFESPSKFWSYAWIYNIILSSPLKHISPYMWKNIVKDTSPYKIYSYLIELRVTVKRLCFLNKQDHIWCNRNAVFEYSHEIIGHNFVIGLKGQLEIIRLDCRFGYLFKAYKEMMRSLTSQFWPTILVWSIENAIQKFF